MSVLTNVKLIILIVKFLSRVRLLRVIIICLYEIIKSLTRILKDLTNICSSIR